uniref:Uncharacterized protein n=1 Tax=Mus spicilegus TaxID=10103 RepID=A0A8C6GHR5_MUSSI
MLRSLLTCPEGLPTHGHLCLPHREKHPIRRQKFGSPIGSSGSCSDTRGGLLEMAPGHHIRFLDPNMEELEREKYYMLMDASGVCLQPVVFPGLSLETEVASFLPWGRLHS